MNNMNPSQSKKKIKKKDNQQPICYPDSHFKAKPKLHRTKQENG